MDEFRRAELETKFPFIPPGPFAGPFSNNWSPVFLFFGGTKSLGTKTV